MWQAATDPKMKVATIPAVVFADKFFDAQLTSSQAILDP